MSQNKPVDLDALEKLQAAATQGEWLRDGALVYTLVHSGWWKGVEQFQNRGTFRAHVQRLPSGEATEAAEAQAIADTEYLHFVLCNLPALIAELRELRELVGCATEYELKRATVRCVPTRDGDEHEWEVCRDSGPTNAYPILSEALAAARQWEAENAF